MPYKFTFDLSRISRFFFSEISKASYQKGVHRKVGKSVQNMIKKFKIQEATGLNLSDAVVLLQDMIDMHSKNLMERERFEQAKKRVLFLPHCSRKHMESHCKASFDPSIPSYICAHCSPDCLVNKAVFLAEKKGYEVYILPGGSCVPKIVKTRGYEGVVGVACGEETRLSGELLGGMGVAGQAVPLIKNGCANTIFNIETLASIL
ncbi:DUF116 domain-containing protein [Candidatus Bathyarchaeota archaeon]|nr:DUF116 domain-containing protein [Candidatus Bathyarchaeota archaeon]